MQLLSGEGRPELVTKLAGCLQPCLKVAVAVVARREILEFLVNVTKVTTGEVDQGVGCCARFTGVEEFIAAFGVFLDLAHNNVVVIVEHAVDHVEMLVSLLQYEFGVNLRVTAIVFGCGSTEEPLCVCETIFDFVEPVTEVAVWAALDLLS